MAALPALSPRERALIGLAAPVLALALGWQFLWQPLQADRADLRDRIAEARTLQAALDAAPEGQAAPRAAPQGPAATRLTRSAEAAGITLARIEPRGGTLTAFVEDASFDRLIAWIAGMETDEALRLTAVALDRRPAPGVVSARLELEDAP